GRDRGPMGRLCTVDERSAARDVPGSAARVRRLLAAAGVATAVLLAGCAAGPAPAESPSPTPTETTTALTDLAAGECYDQAGQGVVLVLDCGEAHTYEVFASLLLDA